MARYSHSKLECFENCPYQYKLKYIDKIKPEIPTSVEAFMGSLVHSTLELLHKKLLETGWRLSKEELILHYDKLWQQKWTEDILIVKNGMGADDYRGIGRRFLRDYYDRYYPFDNYGELIGVETEDLLDLPDGNEWHVRMDLFARDIDGTYYIIDHKTNSKMKEQWEADTDKQLAMYSIWVKKKYGSDVRVKLVWNMLAFNQQIISEPTEKRLEKLIEDQLIKISKIENAKEYPAKITALCKYCGYQNICEFYKKAKEEERI